MYPILRPSFQAFIHRHTLVRPLTFVDIGLRNGLHELSDVAALVDAYGFEPNHIEYQKLVTGSHGRKVPPYNSVSYYPYAVADTDGKRTFYITPSAGACSLYKPDIDRLREFIFVRRPYKKNFGDDLFAGYTETEVEVRSLATAMHEKNIAPIDYLKLDIQGSEYDVLSGAEQLLKDIGVIKTEVCFIPFYQRQKLFSDIDTLLRSHGFDLLRYEFDNAHVGYKRRRMPMEYLGRKQVDPHAQVLWGDAVYVNRSLNDKSRLLAQAIVLLEQNYVDEAAFILETKLGLADDPFVAQLHTAREPGAFVERVRRIGYAVTDKAIMLLGKIPRIFS